MLDFLTNQLCFVLRCAFLPAATVLALASWFYQSLPLFPFLSPLPCRWRFVVHALWLQCETWVSAVLAGALLTLLFTWNVTQSVQSSWKQSLVIHRDWATHPLFWLITGAYPDDQTFCIFRNGWIDCRDAFHAVLHLYHCVKNNHELKGRGMQVKCVPCPFN